LFVPGCYQHFGERWKLLAHHFSFREIIEERDLSEPVREYAPNENPSTRSKHARKLFGTRRPVENVVVDIGQQGNVKGTRFEGKLFGTSPNV
jgi:hypothetical protein